MTGQSMQRPTARSAERTGRPQAHPAGRRPSAQRPDQRPADRHPSAQRPGAGRGGPGPRGPLARPQASWVLIALPVLGALVDEITGAPLGGVFAVCTVLASAWAALLVTRRGLWWVLPSPPLVVAAVALVDLTLLHSSDFAGTKLGTGLLKWSVDLFPTMFFALLAAAAGPALRRVLTRRAAARAPRATDDAQVPVPRRSHHG